ncbi:hypothetical protein HMPREF9094_2289 [Fusobacterium animalis ATCC 51191]|uniref:Uncharacterized protein n=1 Tax=Fusobacterium animalis ATCC 51191 TaxID=997347 RepID=F9EQT4_9FUSO|nr:hypothetical protein HMPREF9094_2289 [Fusobacterium animalis ATCC 51191]
MFIIITSYKYFIIKAYSKPNNIGKIIIQIEDNLYNLKKYIQQYRRKNNYSY